MNQPRRNAPPGRTRESALRIALIYPELLGTYGDSGNARILLSRARWRGWPGVLVEVPAGEPVPGHCDLYLLGGGEDSPQTLAAAGLRRGGAWIRSLESAAVCLAVCAGFQLLGESFQTVDGEVEGLGLLECRTRAGDPRVVGDLAVEPDPALGLPVLLGYENHAGRTTLGSSARPLGRVLRGTGNGAGAGTEGAIQGQVIATYLHGPVLAQNPALADYLLDLVGGGRAHRVTPESASVVASVTTATERLRAARSRQLGL